MSDAVAVALITLMSVALSQLVTWMLNKRKSVDDSSLSHADLIKKYQDIASDQADANDNLETKLLTKDQEIQSKEKEKKDWMSKYEEILQELKTQGERHDDELREMESRHNAEIRELKDSFAQEKADNLLWRDWARRLVLQVKSYGLDPVPFQPEDILKKANQPEEKK